MPVLRWHRVAAAFARARQLADVQRLQRHAQGHDRVNAFEKGPRAARVFRGPVAQGGSAADHTQRQHVLQVDRIRAQVQRVGYQQQRAGHGCSGSSPTARSS